MYYVETGQKNPIVHKGLNTCIIELLVTARAVTLIFISGRCSAISTAIDLTQ